MTSAAYHWDIKSTRNSFLVIFIFSHNEPQIGSIFAKLFQSHSNIFAHVTGTVDSSAGAASLAVT